MPLLCRPRAALQSNCLSSCLVMFLVVTRTSQNVLKWIDGGPQRTRWKVEIGAQIMRKTKRKFGCPVEFSIDVLSGKWKTVILSRLKVRPMRYGELREVIPSLSDKVLTERLHDLRNNGF